MSGSVEPAVDPGIEQREMMELLSQETRHSVIMAILGHPDHLASLTEIEEMVPKSTGAITDGLDVLEEEGLLRRFETVEPDNPNDRDYPETFWGPTERGIRIFHEYNFLRLVPAQRALFDRSEKSDTMERHLSADRPPLPAQIADALAIEDSNRGAEQEDDEELALFPEAGGEQEEVEEYELAASNEEV